MREFEYSRAGKSHAVQVELGKMRMAHNGRDNLLAYISFGMITASYNDLLVLGRHRAAGLGSPNLPAMRSQNFNEYSQLIDLMTLNERDGRKPTIDEIISHADDIGLLNSITISKLRSFIEDMIIELYTINRGPNLAPVEVVSIANSQGRLSGVVECDGIYASLLELRVAGLKNAGMAGLAICRALNIKPTRSSEAMTTFRHRNGYIETLNDDGSSDKKITTRFTRELIAQAHERKLLDKDTIEAVSDRFARIDRETRTVRPRPTIEPATLELERREAITTR